MPENQLPFRTFDEIHRLIDQRERESKVLEFKAAGEFNPSRNRDNLIEDLTKTVTSFANAVGGTIIYGLKEDNLDEHNMGVASQIDWLSANHMTAQRLDHLLSNHIEKAIESLEIHVIENQQNRSQFVLVVHVPESPRAPHMASDGRYWRRTSTGLRRMDDDEIRDVMFRRQQPDLSIHFVIDTISPDTLLSRTLLTDSTLTLLLQVRNDGRASAKYVAGELLVAPGFTFNNSSSEFQPPKTPQAKPGELRFDLGSKVIHPDMEVDVGRISVSVPHITLPERRECHEILRTCVWAQFMNRKRYVHAICGGPGKPRITNEFISEPEISPKGGAE